MTDGTVAIQERVEIEPSPSYNPEGRMHAADTAGLFPHTARPVRGSSRTMKSEPPSHQLHASTSNSKQAPPPSPPIASTGNRPVTGACIGGDSGGDGGSGFIVLELPRTRRAVSGRYQ